MGTSGLRLLGVLAAAALILGACSADSDAPGIDAAERYAEDLSEAVVDAHAGFVAWAQDAEREADRLADLAEELRQAEAADDDLPDDDTLAAETRDEEEETVSGVHVLERLDRARAEVLRFAAALEDAAERSGREFGAALLGPVNDASGQANAATAELREELAGAGT